MASWKRIKAFLTTPRAKSVWRYAGMFSTAFIGAGGCVTTSQRAQRYWTGDPTVEEKIADTNLFSGALVNEMGGILQDSKNLWHEINSLRDHVDKKQKDTMASIRSLEATLNKK